MQQENHTHVQNGNVTDHFSDEVTDADLAVAEILLELVVERGISRLQLNEYDFDEIMRRLAHRGYTLEDLSS